MAKELEGYSDVGSPVAQKSQFVMSLLEQLDQEHELSSKDKSIIDRCTGDLYKNYKHGGPRPTLLSLRELLIAQPEPEARDLALSLELFTEGSLNAFAYPTNVNTNSRIVVYDILDLGEQLKTMGLLVITDAILNRVTENWKKGKRTHVYLDEFHVVYKNPYSSMFFTSAWRRFRKRNAFPHGNHPERGISAGQCLCPLTALQLGADRHAQSGFQRPGTACRTIQYL